MCNHLYQVFVKHILLQSSLVVFSMRCPSFLVSKGRGFFVWKIYFEFKEMIELKKAKLNKQKNLVNQGFFNLFLCPLHAFVRNLLIKNNQKY